MRSQTYKDAHENGVHYAAACAANRGEGDYDTISRQLAREGYGEEFDAHPDYTAAQRKKREDKAFAELCEACGFTVAEVLHS